jgi:hypothetical protein
VDVGLDHSVAGVLVLATQCPFGDDVANDHNVHKGIELAISYATAGLSPIRSSVTRSGHALKQSETRWGAMQPSPPEKSEKGWSVV